MSRTNRVVGGVGVGYVSQAVMTAVGLWLTPFLLRHLGREDYGLWLLALQTVAYLGLLDLGVVALLPRQISYVIGRAGSREQAAGLAEVTGHTLRVILWQLPVVAAGAALGWWWLGSQWPELRGPSAAILLVFLAFFPARVFQGTLQGLQDLTVVGSISLGSWLLGTAVTITLLETTSLGIYSVACGWATTQTASTALSLLRLRSRFPAALPRGIPKTSSQAVRSTLVSGGWLSVAQVAQVLVAATDLMIVAKVVGLWAVVPYSLTKKLIDVLSNQPQMIMQAAFPALSELRVAADRPRLRQVTGALTQAMLLGTSAVGFGVLLVNQGFVTWWVGPEQFGGLKLTFLLVLLLLLRHWNTTAVFSTLCFGHERRISLTNLADGVVTVVLGAGLGRIFGLPGIVMGSIAGVLLVSLPGNLRALARETGVQTTALLRDLAPLGWRFAALAIVGALTASRWHPNSAVALVATAVAGGSFYLLLMGPLCVREPLGSYVRHRLPPFLVRWVPAHGSSD